MNIILKDLMKLQEEGVQMTRSLKAPRNTGLAAKEAKISCAKQQLLS